MTHSIHRRRLGVAPPPGKRSLAGIAGHRGVKASSMVAEMVGKPLVLGDNPQVDAQFSIPYTVSAAIMRGDVFLGDFELGAINDPKILAMADLVTVAADPAIPSNDLLRADIAVVLKEGNRLTSLIEAPLGNPARPMDMAMCRDKFSKCLAYSGMALDPGRVDELLNFIAGLENADDAGRMAQLAGG